MIFRTVLFGMPQKSSSFSGPTTKGVRGGGGKVLATKKKHFFYATKKIFYFPFSFENSPLAAVSMVC